MKSPLLILLLLGTIFTSCRKYVEVDSPINSITSANVYTNNTTAAAVLTGIYTSISSNSFSGTPAFNSLSYFAGLSADELILFNGITDTKLSGFYTNTLNSGVGGSPSGPEFWTNTYPIIYRANSAIEGINQSSSLAQDVKQQLLGEAKFIRAFSYFYLTNIYGEIPLILTTDVTANASVGRSSASEVYQQIIIDLKDAQQLLNGSYVGSDAKTVTIQRLRPNKWVATALLSRVYLYNHDWQNAEDQATSIINQKTIYDTVSFGSSPKIFDMNSKEVIWQIQPVNAGENTPDAKVFILPGSGPSLFYPVYLQPTFVNGFEAGDKRKANWVGSVTVSSQTYNYAFKYKINTPNAPVSEYEIVFRLAEQYLIRAEARAQLNKINDSQSDVNVIRTRAGLSNTTANNKPSLLSTILKERQVELFTEWGHRWLDLKRTQTVDAVMSVITPQKGGTWEMTDQLYPLPFTDIQLNTNFIQNQGY
jgi:hypothetical protein